MSANNEEPNLEAVVAEKRSIVDQEWASFLGGLVRLADAIQDCTEPEQLLGKGVMEEPRETEVRNLAFERLKDIGVIPANALPEDLLSPKAEMIVAVLDYTIDEARHMQAELRST